MSDRPEATDLSDYEWLIDEPVPNDCHVKSQRTYWVWTDEEQPQTDEEPG
jgi:hypothetical protein